MRSVVSILQASLESRLQQYSFPKKSLPRHIMQIEANKT